ncbi:HTTM domain-containing protein [Crocosphaera sp. XPORK-15E]|uniref:HTTM domain-containing protein n=1 Tax=Crocosphaera sp. XPORK-15E TaxID=3110247 RepID=UPI002B1EAF8F|nr:HTTM domain-containing protein [Crocosphaera sp. XPORK-15E]MEA5533011.1 HTTM domain-containing protein [Crocosphaera sp. XPORK-15E]
MSELIRKSIKRFYDFWFQKESTLTLGFFRIVFGLFIFVVLLVSYFDWEEFYGVQGMITLDRFIDARGGWFLASFKSLFALSDSPQFVWVIYGATLLTTIAFILGIGTRITTIILYILWFSICNRNTAIIDGKDLIIRMLLFYSCFAPLGNSLSVDNFLRRKWGKKHQSLTKYYPQKKSVWSWRLLQLSIALIYPLSALDKLRSDIAWREGNIMYYISLYDEWFRFSDVDFLHSHIMSMAMTYGTLILELSFFIFIWFKRTKYPMLILMSLLHISIAILMNAFVLQISAVMLVSYTLFLEPETVRKFLSYFQRNYRFSIGEWGIEKQELSNK